MVGARPLSRLLRGVSGVLAGGLVALLVALVVAHIVAGDAGSPGPGSATIVWHAVAAAVAVPAQWTADRRRGPVGVVAALFVVAVAAAVLLFLWVL